MTKHKFVKFAKIVKFLYSHRREGYALTKRKIRKHWRLLEEHALGVR
jgi:hypothetical protein